VKLFDRDFIAAGEYELYVAALIYRAGLPVCLERRVIAESAAFRDDFLEQMDIWVYSDGVEVKGLHKTFTSPDDYPFDDIWIGDASRWDRRKKTPLAVALVSIPTEAVIVLPVARTRPLWSQASAVDGRRGMLPNVSYAAPRSCFITWEQFIDGLQRRWPLSSVQEGATT